MQIYYNLTFIIRIGGFTVSMWQLWQFYVFKLTCKNKSVYFQMLGILFYFALSFLQTKSS